MLISNPRETLRFGNFELDVAGDRIPARAGLTAPYDPHALRVKS